MPIVCSIFSPFVLNEFLRGSLVVAYVCTFHPNRGLKWTHLRLKKWSYFAKKRTVEA